MTADSRRIVQVIGNLLSNAATHSPETSVIGVTAARKGIQVEISVTDEGRGIPPDDLPHLFAKFSRSDTAGAKGTMGGSGLGLAICRGIVEAHGGRIRAESKGTGTGARFVFTLPVAERTETEPLRRACGPTRRRPPRTTYPGGGRRPPSAQVRTAGSGGCRLRTSGHRGPTPSANHDTKRQAQPGPARHDARRHRWDQTNARHTRRSRTSPSYSCPSMEKTR